MGAGPGWARPGSRRTRSPRWSTSATTSGCTGCASARTWTAACTPWAAASTPSAGGAGPARPGRCATSWPPTGPTRPGSGSATGTPPPTWSAPGCCAPATRSPTSPRRCATAGSPGCGCCPVTDDRVETHVVIDDPETGPQARKAIHFQEWWIRHKAAPAPHAFASIGAEQATLLPAVTGALARADAVLLAPSNPVVSIGALLDVPGARDALRSAPGRVVGPVPDRGRAAAARYGRRLPGRDRRRVQRGGGRAALRRAHRGRPARRLAGAHRRRRGRARGRGPRGAAADDRRRGDGRDGPARAGAVRCRLD